LSFVTSGNIRFGLVLERSADVDNVKFDRNTVGVRIMQRRTAWRGQGVVARG